MPEHNIFEWLGVDVAQGGSDGDENDVVGLGPIAAGETKQHGQVRKEITAWGNTNIEWGSRRSHSLCNGGGASCAARHVQLAHDSTRPC